MPYAVLQSSWLIRRVIEAKPVRSFFNDQTDQQCIEVRLDSTQDMVWLNQAQLVELFERDQSVISRHMHNVFKDGELDNESNTQKMHIAASDKPVTFYSLDVIISVG